MEEPQSAYNRESTRGKRGSHVVHIYDGVICRRPEGGSSLA